MESVPVPDALERAQLARETRWLLLSWALALVLVLGSTAYWAHGGDRNGGWVWAQMLTLASVPGKYVIFSGVSGHSPLDPWGLALLAVGADLVVALTLAVGMGPLERVPVVGPALRRLHDRAHEVLTEYQRLRRMAFWGVVVFVYLPLPASGSVGGTFVGQLLGLSRTLGLVAVMLGGILVSVTFAALAQTLGSQAQALAQNPWVTAGAVAAFALALVLGLRRARRLLRN
jgi:uncharacterized membrane protein